MKPKPKQPKSISFRTFPKQFAKRKRPPLASYVRFKDQFLKDFPWCQSCFDAKSTEIHHSHGRLGMLLINEKYWIALCSTCHRYVHDHPTWARSMGLLCAKGEWNKQ